MTWVLTPLITQQTGMTRDQLRSMARRGLLKRGEHYAVIDRKTLWNTEALQAWLDSQASAQAGQESRSAGNQGERFTRDLSIAPRQRPTYRMQLDYAAS